MTKIHLNHVAQYIGTAGVIVGILLLVYELNQNREMMRAQIRNDLSQALVEILFQSADAPRTDLLIRGDSGENLTELESQQYFNMTAALLRYHENVHYQYRNGLFDEAEFLAQRNIWRDNVFRNKGIVEIFCTVRSGLSPEFVAEIDGLLTTYRCE